MKRLLMVVVTSALVVGSVTAAEADEPARIEPVRMEEASYGAPFVAQVTGCSLSGRRFGCLYVNPLPNEAFFTARVTDAHGQPVAFEVFWGPPYRRQHRFFCGEVTSPFRFDPGAEELAFYVGIVWPLDVYCPTSRAATTGTIQVTMWAPAEPQSPGSTEPTLPSERPEPTASATPSPTPPTETRPALVERSVDFSLRKHLRGRGAVLSDDPACRFGVPVLIHRKGITGWVEVGSTTTDPEGLFAVRLKDRQGRYRAIAPEVGSADRTCLDATSASARHRH